MDVLTAYFQKLNTDTNIYDDNDARNSEDHSEFKNEFINNPFTLEEVVNNIKNLKYSKAPGHDLILNEFLK